MNQQIAHLIVFLASLAAVVVLVITGHDTNTALDAVLAGLVGGSGGQTGINVLTGAFTPQQASPQTLVVHHVAAVAQPLPAGSPPPAGPPIAARPPASQAGRARISFVAMLALLITLGLSVGACSMLAKNVPNGSQVQDVEYGCAAISSVLPTLTARAKAGAMSKTEQAKITAALQITTPICESQTPPNFTAATMNAFSGAVGALTSLAGPPLPATSTGSAHP